MTEAVLKDGLKHYAWNNDPFIPVEFSVAAYRFGHSQVRPSYRANFGTSATDATQQFFGLIFDPSPVGLGSRGPARRPASAAPVHRLADVLRLRRRSRAAQQADRHDAVDAVVRPPRSAGRRAELARLPEPRAQPGAAGAV